jgi:hypothetical protein
MSVQQHGGAVAIDVKVGASYLEDQQWSGYHGQKQAGAKRCHLTVPVGGQATSLQG